MKQIIDNIRHHSEIFGEPVFDEYTEISEERLQHVVKLIKSELNELIDAKTIDEQKDGCGDVLWTVIRAFQEYGIENKLDYYYNSKDRFNPFFESVSQIQVNLHTLRNIESSKEGIALILSNLLLYALELFVPFGYDRDYIMEQVYNSNMSKLCITETEAQATVKAYFEGTHPDKMGVEIETYYKKATQGFVVYRKSDNKYLKSINFVEPKFD